MTRPLTATEIRTAFRTWAVPFRERSGWTTRSNSGHWVIDGSATHVTGVMYHHTGDGASDSVTENLLVNGRSDLPGPLCNFMAADDGYIVCIAQGSANHAGKGDPDTLRLVQDDAMPLDREVQPNQHSSSAGSVAGNGRYYGWESAYGGTADPDPNVKQHRATLLSMAAILWALDRIDTSGARWSGGSMLGHREWTDWKPDPQHVNLATARRTINSLLKAGPSSGPGFYRYGTIGAPAPAPTPTPTPTPTTAQEPTMIFARLKSSDPAVANPVILTDGFTARHVRSSAEWAAIQTAYTGTTGRTPQAGVVDSLVGLAVKWEGPVPPANASGKAYPIPADWLA